MDEIRSLLFVPGDSERKIAKALTSAADALILDLEDSVVPASRPSARETCLAALRGERSKPIIVRVNALDTEDALPDLAALVRGRPDAIMLPKCRSDRDVHLLHHYLTALEVRDDIEPGTIKILPIATETGGAMFGAGTYAPDTPRLAGLLWGAEDLAADIGAVSSRDGEGRYGAPFDFARTLCLLAATAARVKAVDAVYTDFRDPVGLRSEAEIAARDGFTAKAAIHPDQVDVINAVFTPNAEAVAHARRVVDVFESGQAKGVASLDGRMLDRPHYIMAKRILGRARQA